LRRGSDTVRESASPADYLKSWPLYLLPHHLLSRIVLAATRLRAGIWKNMLIRWFIDRYHVDLGDAVETDPATYRDFNSFFTRPLRPEARPLYTAVDAILSPVDGRVSQVGELVDGRIVQAKGRSFSLVELLGGAARRAAPFLAGQFVTLYLCPRDYHRVHMPSAGQLLETVYIPGRLFSVAPHTTRTIPNLFARNERLVSIFATANGPLALIMVGAMLVACIETVWSGIVTPPHRSHIRMIDYRSSARAPVKLAQGDEMGRFNMGSTVILLYGRDRAEWLPGLLPGTGVHFGQLLGRHPRGNNAVTA
jgi:phosphatidylserine decarboxylase